MRDKILEIIQENYNKFKGSNEAELHSSIEIEELFTNQWISVDERLPEMNEEYLASIDLDDEYNTLICFAVQYRLKTKTWVWSNTEEVVQGTVMFWMEKPKPHPYIIPPKTLEQNPISLDEFERVVYGQCTHGENLASCTICNPEKT